MGFFDSLKNLFGRVDETEKQVQDLLEQADNVTNMIPGDADDKLVDGLKEKVENLTNQYDEVKKNIPGSGN